MQKHGYALVAGNSAGNNLFFVKRTLLNDRVKEITAQAAFAEACFAESRDQNGRLTHLAFSARASEISELPLIDVSTGETVRVGNVCI
jgi:hypothetical protein